jgi:hypothetical protein
VRRASNDVRFRPATHSQVNVNIRDLHATMLHLLGIDHQRFSVNFHGLDARLTGVEPARLLREILA